MLYLLTSNKSKYAPFAEMLSRLQIELRVPDFELPEMQDKDFVAVLGRKARLAAEALGEPCLVDDAGLLLDAYPGFPGPLTGPILKSLGVQGLAKLLDGMTDRARMVCHLGCWIDGKLWHWQGEVSGRFSLTDETVREGEASVCNSPGPLTRCFIPDESDDGSLLHRRRALEAFERDIDRVRHAIATDGPCVCSQAPSNPDCVFCREFDEPESSIYHELLGDKLPSRLIHATEHFLVFPPLGQFVEGGLLITTREHWLSMGHLPDAYYEELERLMAETSEILQSHYGCKPLFFEHAPVSTGDKGTCCVDHAHLNIFPVRVEVHEQIKKKFPYLSIGGMCQLKTMAKKNQAYLFLQTNNGTRFVYDAGIVPSQYIRRIVTSELNMAERWHWRDYLGLDELERTVATLAGWRKSHEPRR